MDDIKQLSSEISKMAKVFAQYVEQDVEKKKTITSIESEFITVSHRTGSWDDSIRKRFDTAVGQIEDERWREELFGYFSSVFLSELSSSYIEYAVSLAKCLEGLANHRFEKVSADALRERIESINKWFNFTGIADVYKDPDSQSIFLKSRNDDEADSEKLDQQLHTWFEKLISSYYHLFVFPPTIGVYFVKGMEKVEVERDIFNVNYQLESLGACFQPSQPLKYVADTGDWIEVRRFYIKNREMCVYGGKARKDEKYLVTYQSINRLLKIGEQIYTFWEVLRLLRNVHSHGFVKLEPDKREMYEAILEGDWDSASFVAYGNQILSECFRYERMSNS